MATWATLVEARYAKGVLTLVEPLDLQDGAAVQLLILAQANHEGDAASADQDRVGISAEDARAWFEEVRQLPLEANDAGDTFSGRDHDRILYGLDKP